MSMQRILAECKRGVFLYCSDQDVPWSYKSYISRLSLLVLSCMHQSNELQRVLSPVSGFFWYCMLRKGYGHGLWVYSSTLSCSLSLSDCDNTYIYRWSMTSRKVLCCVSSICSRSFRATTSSHPRAMRFDVATGSSTGCKGKDWPTGPRHDFFLSPIDCVLNRPTLSAKFIIRTMAVLCVACAWFMHCKSVVVVAWAAMEKKTATEGRQLQAVGRAMTCT